MRRDANTLFAGPVEHVRRTRYAGRVDREPIIPATPGLAAELRRLESMAARLTVYHGYPERFFEERSELQAALGKLARQLERNR